MPVLPKPPDPLVVSDNSSTMVNSIPKVYLRDIKNILVGENQALLDRNLQAMYVEEEGSIFITHKQETNEDMLDDLIHEVAHAVESRYFSLIYSDEALEKEFLLKRKKLWRVLNKENPKVQVEPFLNKNYTEEFDEFLYKDVGYSFIWTMAPSLFYSPYAATSINEYFANGFEAFYMKKDLTRLKQISPQLYKKLVEMPISIENERELANV